MSLRVKDEDGGKYGSNNAGSINGCSMIGIGIDIAIGIGASIGDGLISARLDVRLGALCFLTPAATVRADDFDDDDLLDDPLARSL